MRRPTPLLHRLFIVCLCFAFSPSHSTAQTNNDDSLFIKPEHLGGTVYMLHCENGFGGGNVTASIGKDGVLLADNMYKKITPLLLAEIKKISAAGVRVVINSHFHRDHIEGNDLLSATSVIIAHQNLHNRLKKSSTWATAASMPQILVSDSLKLQFNGEDIQVIHFPKGHSDNDLVVFFRTAQVVHLGDMFFQGMFPAIYTESGGNLHQLIINLEKILLMIPDEVKIVPGHGALATKQDLLSYIKMLKETREIVISGIKAGKTLQQLQEEKVLSHYDKLGSGGAQSTDQYLAMLYKLLST